MFFRGRYPYSITSIASEHILDRPKSAQYSSASVTSYIVRPDARAPYPARRNRSVSASASDSGPANTVPVVSVMSIPDKQHRRIPARVLADQVVMDVPL